MEDSSGRSYKNLVARDHALIVAGDIIYNNQGPPPRDYKGSYSYSFLRVVATFVQRPSLHDNLQKQLTRERFQDNNQGSRVVVVCGLGGTGKSQLVLSYFQQHRWEYTASFWIEAGRKETIERDFLRVYHLLFDVTGQGDVKIEDAVLGVKKWVVEREGRWLFVFDGADSIDRTKSDKNLNNYVNIEHFIPDTPSVDVILTTRSPSAEGLTPVEVVKVGEMEAVEATALFQKCSKMDCKGHDKATVNKIVGELGFLALAVSLSGTYVYNTPRLKLDLQEYLDEYRTRRKEILAEMPTWLVHQYGDSVLTTWETTFEAVTQQCDQASKFLTLLGFINFDDIFIDLFLPISQDNSYEQNKEDGAGVVWYNRIFGGAEPDMYTIEKCFRVLQSYGLLQWKPENSYAMHKLVHAWVFDRLHIEDQRRYVLRSYVLPSLSLLFNAISKAGHTPKARQRLVPHIMANFEAVSKADLQDLDIEIAIRLFKTSGDLLSNEGRWIEAYGIRKFVYFKTLAMRGGDHRQTISAMGDLANTLGGQGKLEEAAAMNKEVLEKRKRILGKEHLNTISAMNNLAVTLGNQGKLEEAAAMKREAS
ncbi:uncharacterized protein BDR25DRAFT_346092 [Lindgomyces ingoldianus]|uniref:Uncharacterized protein n=1 Tax=Lindgomyces ingoldianus TaxID=673940 RepID=A0ACB6QFC8_9PLEO|nr:uncharacterized protein BDR25DRAFT_346092 [Lindgomyces ingoldianus]KAF2465570.1 hypothetical protein BDR25DRAFT_346092 [Lindgomyces ingoldianus]